MKRLIYMAVLAMIAFASCEYHPYYDGQALCIYGSECGLIRTDGVHVNVPVVSREPYVLELYGGKGCNHTIVVDDSDILGYEYSSRDVQHSIADESDLIPAKITLRPKKKGDTCITIKDDDTGESIMMFIHVCDAYKAIQLFKGNSDFYHDCILAFNYGELDDVVRICRGNVYTGNIEHIVDGHYRFVDIEGYLHLELTFTAGENGRVAAEGTEVQKLYQVQFISGGAYGADLMLEYLNLSLLPTYTRKVESDVDVMPSYKMEFMFIDVTGVDLPNVDSLDGEQFFAYSAEIIPWVE